MADSVPPEEFAVESQDIVASIVRALVLYSVAEFQSGNATAIHVKARGVAFEVSDDGRGHALQREVAGVPYLAFVYTHLEYPFTSPGSAPIQLHTIGLSLIATLCGELAVSVHKQNEAKRFVFRRGRLCEEREIETKPPRRGNVISGVLAEWLPRASVDTSRLRAWLERVGRANVGVRITMNGEDVCGSVSDDA